MIKIKGHSSYYRPGQARSEFLVIITKPESEVILGDG